MAVKLIATIRLLPTDRGGRDTPLRTGWRGVIAFGERWTEADRPLWPESRELPVGEDLVYGCELQLVGPESQSLAPGEEARAELLVWAIDQLRPAMRPGATAELREGSSAVGTAKVLGISPSPDTPAA